MTARRHSTRAARKDVPYVTPSGLECCTSLTSAPRKAYLVTQRSSSAACWETEEGTVDLPIRSSSACRSGLGSSRFNGSMNRLASGSGGQRRDVSGLRGDFSSTSLSVDVGVSWLASAAVVDSGAVVSGLGTSRDGAGALPPAWTHDSGVRAEDTRIAHPCAPCSISQNSCLVSEDNRAYALANGTRRAAVF